MSSSALQRLQVSALRTLAGALRDGLSSRGLSSRSVELIAGPHATEVQKCLRDLQAQGMSPEQVALVVEAVADTKERTIDAASMLELVLSGPDVPGIPTRDTAAVMHALIEAAQQEVLLVGYAVYNGDRLFARLAERMGEDASLRVVFCLDIARAREDTSLSSEIVRRYAHEFTARQWPWNPLPELYYDPRSLEPTLGQRSSLHAKCIVIDRKQALVTSANFTEAAQQRNIEVGIHIRHQPIAQRLSEYFEAMIASGGLRQCDLDRLA